MGVGDRWPTLADRSNQPRAPWSPRRRVPFNSIHFLALAVTLGLRVWRGSCIGRATADTDAALAAAGGSVWEGREGDGGYLYGHPWREDMWLVATSSVRCHRGDGES